jgi:hypothetical protein
MLRNGLEEYQRKEMCVCTFVDDAGVQLDGNGSSYDLAEEAAGIS